MNVTCPNCATVYRVDPAKVPESGRARPLQRLQRGLRRPAGGPRPSRAPSPCTLVRVRRPPRRAAGSGTGAADAVPTVATPAPQAAPAGAAVPDASPAGDAGRRAPGVARGAGGSGRAGGPPSRGRADPAGGPGARSGARSSRPRPRPWPARRPPPRARGR